MGGDNFTTTVGFPLITQKRHGVKVGSGLRDQGPQVPWTRTRGPLLKFKNGTWDPPEV